MEAFILGKNDQAISIENSAILQGRETTQEIKSFELHDDEGQV